MNSKRYITGKSSPTLRLAKASDHKEVIEVFNSAVNHICPDRFLNWLRDSHQLLTVAELDDKIVGVACVFLIDDGKTLMLHSVRVKLNYQGCGIFRELYNFVMNVASQRFPDVRRIRCQVILGNRIMLGFTKRRGFRQIVMKEMERYCSDNQVKSLVRDIVKNKTDSSELIAYTGDQFITFHGLEKANQLNIFQDGFMHDFKWPLEPIKGNVPVMVPTTLTWLTDWKIDEFELCESSCKTRSLSHGKCAIINELYHLLQITVYSKESKLVQDHILQQMFHVYQNSQEITHVAITVYPGMIEATREIFQGLLKLQPDPSLFDVKMGIFECPV